MNCPRLGKTAPNSKVSEQPKESRTYRQSDYRSEPLSPLETGNNWNLCRDRHYQLSPLAWSWKLATLGVPVVLMYLGFLNARDMVGEKLFLSPEEWESTIKTHGESVVDNTCWNQWLNISGTRCSVNSRVGPAILSLTPQPACSAWLVTAPSFPECVQQREYGGQTPLVTR